MLKITSLCTGNLYRIKNEINLEYKLQGAIFYYFLKKLIFHYIFQRGPIFKKKSI